MKRRMLGAMPQVLQSQTLPEPFKEVPLPPEAHAASVVLAYLENTKLAVRHQAYEVLRELATQTLARASSGKSTDITALSLKSGLVTNSAKEPSAWLSPHWTRLIDAEKNWQEGMIEEARRSCSAFIPKLEKLLGNPSYYWIRAVSIPDEVVPEPVFEVPNGGIYYTLESIKAPGAFLSKALRAGTIPWTAPARWSLFAVIMVTLLAVLILAWLLLVIAMKVSRPISPADVVLAVMYLLLLGGARSLFRFCGELFDLRIVMAPSLLTPLATDNVTLELQPSTADRAGELVFARYTSTCPICNAAIELFDGGKDFPGRIVGRCRRSAREHIYSFDPTRKIGHPLREQFD